MNIFVTDPCPVKSAKFLDNKRLVKMCLESAQLLSTALNLSGGKGVYKATHKNHPCSLWVKESLDNWIWLWDHFEALGKEYTKRYHRTHLALTKLVESDSLEQAFEVLSDKGLTAFVNCAANKSLGISYKDYKDVHKAYREYLKDRWKNDKVKPSWDVKR